MLEDANMFFVPKTNTVLQRLTSRSTTSCIETVTGTTAIKIQRIHAEDIPIYHQTSNISRNLLDNKLVDHSDAVEA